MPQNSQKFIRKIPAERVKTSSDKWAFVVDVASLYVESVVPSGNAAFRFPLLVIVLKIFCEIS